MIKTIFSLENVRQVGIIRVIGGVATLLVGMLAQIIVSFAPTSVLGVSLLYAVLIASGWFLFNQLLMSSLFAKIIKPDGPTSLTTLPAFSTNHNLLEIIFMTIMAISVGGVQLLLGLDLQLAMGGFTGGWLIGGGLGRLRFAAKIGQEAQAQGRNFYFSDTTLGPRTQVFILTNNVTDKELPPGVKRRSTISRQL